MRQLTVKENKFTPKALLLTPMVTVVVVVSYMRENGEFVAYLSYRAHKTAPILMAIGLPTYFLAFPQTE